MERFKCEVPNCLKLATDFVRYDGFKEPTLYAWCEDHALIWKNKNGLLPGILPISKEEYGIFKILQS